MTEELKITCAVEGKLGKQRVKFDKSDVNKGNHKVKSNQVEDLEDGECTEPVSSGLSGSQQLNPSQKRRKTLNNTRKDKFTNKTRPSEMKVSP